jgi:hypothetical protein
MTAGDPPSFYMALDLVRPCWVLGRIAGPRPTGYWHVRVEPPISGSLMGFMPDQDEAILAERHAGTDLGRMDETTVVSVYVCAILNRAAVARGVITEDDVRLVAWADVSRDPSRLKALP